jgi:soluble P-type ATPase
MLSATALGIAVIGREGAALQAVADADVVCTSVLDALALLHEPARTTATLRP